MSLIFDECCDGLWRHIRHYFHSIILFLKQASQRSIRQIHLPRSFVRYVRTNNILYDFIDIRMYKVSYRHELRAKAYSKIFSIYTVFNFGLFLTESYHVDSEDGAKWTVLFLSTVCFNYGKRVA